MMSYFTAISIHALREEGDLGLFVKLFISIGFLSTPSARRATVINFAVYEDSIISIHALREEGDGREPHTWPGHSDFYPRPPRGGRPCRPLADEAVQPISIHALREEGDIVTDDISRSDARFLSTPSARRATLVQCRFHCGKKFLSTPSARRATGICARYELQYIISIHALREEGDTDCNCIFHIRAISIHALREEGDIRLDPERRRLQAFLSTPSARRATASSRNMRRTKLYFYPRPPRGGRHLEITSEILASLFLSTPSARRATFRLLSLVRFLIYFYPRPPRGGRLPQIFRFVKRFLFLSTPSARRATV